MRSLLLFGSTGSIGRQALEMVRASPGCFRVEALAAHSSWKLLLEQANEFRPRAVALVDGEAADAIAPLLPAGTTLLRGPECLAQLADEADYDLALHGVVGAVGLVPSVRVLERGRTLALANKESLVIAGALLMELSRKHAAPILPVDSEHCAIYQCLAGERLDRVRCVYLTASGGALRDWPLEKLPAATPEDALAHPNWAMGARITVDSATLMNKALEVIEAHHLYGLPADRIRVLMHRQSVVHSMVEFVDGAVMAQLSPPDMRGPIHFALHHPERAPAPLVGFSPTHFRELSFDEPDPVRFPALALGYRALELGGVAGAALNAADEVAVGAFLAGELGFQEIPALVRSVMEARAAARADPVIDLETALAADRSARTAACGELEQRARPGSVPTGSVPAGSVAGETNHGARGKP